MPHHQLHFKPFPFFSSPHLQTILGSLINFEKEPSSIQRILTLPDGDKISLEVSKPMDWKPTNLTVLLVHGMCGSHRSSYLIRIANRLCSIGIRVVRFNMRASGSGRGLAKQMPHCGLSGDVLEAVKFLKEEDSNSPIVVVGFSLGGNIVLKMAGEMTDRESKYVKGVIAINPPVDIAQSTEKLCLSLYGFYGRLFCKQIKSLIDLIHLDYGWAPFSFPEKLTIDKINEVYKISRWGFTSIMDYYQKSSSIHVIDKLMMSCRILFSQDDPCIVSTNLTEKILPSNIEIFTTQSGGHMGFLGNPFSGHSFRFMDSLIEQWVKDLLAMPD